MKMSSEKMNCTVFKKATRILSEYLVPLEVETSNVHFHFYTKEWVQMPQIS